MKNKHDQIPAPKKLPKLDIVTNEDLKPFWIGLVAGGGVIRFFKGVGVGFGVSSVIEPILLHYGIPLSSTFLIPGLVTFFALVFFLQHFNSMTWKYNKACAKNNRLVDLNPASLMKKWESEANYYDLRYDPIGDFAEHDRATKTIKRESEKLNTHIKDKFKRIKGRLKDFPALHRPYSVTKLRGKEANYLSNAEHYFHNIELHKPRKKPPVKWYQDYNYVANQFVNLVLGILFGWSLFSLFSGKVGLALIASAFPGGVVACALSWIVFGCAVLLLHETHFESEFKNKVDGIKKRREDMISRTHIVDLKMSQYIVLNKLDKVVELIEAKDRELTNDFAENTDPDPATISSKPTSKKGSRLFDKPSAVDTKASKKRSALRSLSLLNNTSEDNPLDSNPLAHSKGSINA